LIIHGYGDENDKSNVPIMKENEFSVAGKTSTLLLVLFFAIAALINIWRSHVPNPYAFILVLLGFVFFISAKTSNFKKRKIISFGIDGMSENMSDSYRLGYWLMVVGVLITFT